MSSIETNRLLLRLPCESDAPALAALHADPLVAARIMGGVPSGESIELAWRNIAMHIGHWQLRGYGTWVVEEKDSGELIGRVGIWHPPSWPGPELGWLIRPDRWNRGLATESAQAALDWVWRATELPHLVSLITDDNGASIRVASKLGFAPAGPRHVLGSETVEYRIDRPGGRA